MRSAILIVSLAVVTTTARTPQSPDLAKLDEETLRHFQALVRMDTADPPGNEQPAVEYLKTVLEADGIPVESLALEPRRPNLVAHLKGSGRKRPLLIMGHTDVVNVDPKKWMHPPFSATREGGYIYGRGTVDDKDNLVAGLMVMLMLKRQNVALDRDVIFLAEAGEEGSTRIGIQYMVGQHFPQIDAEYLPGRGRRRVTFGRTGQVRVDSDDRKDPARDRADGARHLGPRFGAAQVERRRPPRGGGREGGGVEAARSGSTRRPRAYFKRLASISSPEDAKRYLAVIGSDAALASAADDYFLEREPRHASMLRTSVSPTMIQGGYRINVIPSEAKASLDVRTHPDEDLDAFLGGDEESDRRSRRRRCVGCARRPTAVRLPHGSTRTPSRRSKRTSRNTTRR